MRSNARSGPPAAPDAANFLEKIVKNLQDFCRLTEWAGMKPEAVIFDIGNVLIEWQPERFYDSEIGEERRRALFARDEQRCGPWPPFH